MSKESVCLLNAAVSSLGPTFILFSFQFSAISSSTKAKILGCNVDDVLNDYLQYIFALFVHELAK